jgi:Kef-type K+ transport system membrane component KefB
VSAFGPADGEEPRLPGWAGAARLGAIEAPPRQARSREVLVYLGLVVLPVLVVVGILLARRDAGTTGGGDGHASEIPRLLLAVSVVLASCAGVGVLFRRIGQPAVVGEIATGVLLGPSLLGAVWPAGMRALFPASIASELNALAQLGVILFVFLAGVGFSGAALRGRGGIALVVSHVSITIPFVLGVGLAVLAFTRFAPDRVGFLPFALFLGVSMSITALPVMVRILRSLGLAGTDVGVVAVTCALIDDVTAWTLLALVEALARHTAPSGALATAGLTAAFAVLLLIVVRRLLARLADLLGDHPRRYDLVIVGTLVAVLLAAVATEGIGVHAVFGAFVLGIACPGDHPLFGRISGTLAVPTTMLLPLFFASSGLRTDVRLLGADAAMWGWLAALLAVATAGKLGGATLAARAVGVRWRPALALGTLMNCRGLTGLVVLNVGLEIGVIGPDLFTLMVLVALLSTVATVPLLRLLRGSDGVEPAGQAGEAGGGGELGDGHQQVESVEERVEAGRCRSFASSTCRASSSIPSRR